MNPITSPLGRQSQGPQVGDLQGALQLLVDKALLLARDDAARGAVSEALRRERAQLVYGATTTKLVGRFQEERGLQPNGQVDKATADALNAALKGLLEKSRLVNGTVRDKDKLSVEGLLVTASHVARPSVPLGQAVVNADGRYSIPYDLPAGVAAVNLSVSVSREGGKILAASDVVAGAKPVETIDLNVSIAEAPSAEQHIRGQVILATGLPAEQMKLRLYRRDFGGTATQLQETTTLVGGRYEFVYDAGGKAPSLEVRIVDANDKETVLSKPLNDLTDESRASLNLVAPGALKPQAAEYRRLTIDLAQIVALPKLVDARENADRQDLTVLNRATGWDARLIALAATAERLSADPDVKLAQEPLYGLMRVGLPSDKLLLAQVEPGVVEQALTNASQAGIVDLKAAEIAQFKESFAAFVNRARLAIPAPGSRSTYGEILGVSGLSADAQAKFATAYLGANGDRTKLWAKARDAGLSDADIGKLQLQGKFAFLAGNSAAMTSRLMNKGVDDPAKLVAQDFHRPATWITEILDQAGIPAGDRANLNDDDRRKVDSLIPSAYAGEKTETRLQAYAEDMARKLRLSYPTHVLGRLLETDDKFKLPDAHDSTVALLKTATGQGFRFGETPAAAFLKSNPGVQDKLTDAEFRAAGRQLKTLQAVYQITPSHEAMPVLMNLGMGSAFDVMAYSPEMFAAHYAREYHAVHSRFPFNMEPHKIFDRSQQVSSITYNLFAIAKRMAGEPSVAGMSAPVQVRESARNELIKHFPTLESLFGSMDFCECDHCRSVLSPAAYLVDLMQFTDTEKRVWQNFLDHWKTTHSNQDYPHRAANGVAMKPYDALIERRPDLPHIALTCDNTNTAMPYIDIVNEILEYYVAHGALDEAAAHDTLNVTTEELLAEPQNVIREAYDALRGARYPMQLPFDLSIETVRQFCDYFETPLHVVLDAFRRTDDLFTAAEPYGRAAIFTESLKVSPAEATLFSQADPQATWHELYGYDNAEQATKVATDPDSGQRIDLHSAKALARRLGVTYKDIVDIVRTGFVNPELAKLGLLYKLRVSIQDAQFYLANKALVAKDPATLSEDDQKNRLEVVAFGEQLEALVASFTPTGGAPAVTTAQLEAAIGGIPFDKVLVLADPDVGCDFDKTTFQYANGAAADTIAFLRVNLFVRLWRKLGWSIAETDRALQVFVPVNAPFALAAGANPNASLGLMPLKTALIHLAHLKSLDERLKVGKQGRLKLLSLWSDIATTGARSLYAQLFLSRSVLKSDPVFDHPLGQYLSDPTIKIKDHLVALQGALGLTADDIRGILEDAGKPYETTTLTVPNVSTLYRYGLLAKALKLSVRDLISLKQLSGLDPFKPVHPDPLATVDQDTLFSQTLAFVDVAAEIKEVGLKVEDLDYLLRHRFDDTGKYRPDPAAMQALLKSLAQGVRAIRSEHAVPDDPAALSDDALRQKLGLVLATDVVERFLAMLNGSAEFTAVKSVAAADRLDPVGFAGEGSIREVPYNTTRGEQKLTYRGVLFDTQEADLNARLPKPSGANPHVASPVLAALLDDVQRQARAFFDQCFLRQTAIRPASGFLDAKEPDGTSTFDMLFTPASDVPEAQRGARDRQRRARLAQSFLPYLQQRLIRQFVVQTMTAQTSADSILVESLLTDERLLGGAKPLVDALAACGDRGLTARFFAGVDGVGGADPALGTVLVGEADTSVSDSEGKPLRPAGSKSARIEGYLEVPVDGAYRFSIELSDAHAEAELQFPHLPTPSFLKSPAGGATTLGNQPNEFLELKAGITYRFMLDLRQLNAGNGKLLVQSESLPKGPLSRLTLYSSAAMDGAEGAATLLRKSVQLVQSLGITEKEIRYLLTHPADFDNVSLNDLPTTHDTAPVAAAVTQRFSRLRRLVAYARLKRDLAGGTEDVIGIFEAQGTAGADKLEAQVYPRIATLSRRAFTVVKATAEALWAAPAFGDERPVRRLWDALQIVERFGVSPTSLRNWTAIASPATTAVQRFAIAKDLRETVRARFEPEAWRSVAQPIFDRLRPLQRDALVSYVQHLRKYDRMEQLYEYFLLDPGMEPVVQTSRIRLAIGSLQLFIQRCLLNLEPKVHPSTINAKQWEWMKRYRVWEANRKIFLYPENWLEPEFRDDKTHLFAELEGTLLQGDVSSDLVEDAFFEYLRKLDALARLDIVGMYIEDNIDPALRVLHVFGRTHSQPLKYFYRRYAYQAWTPWEPVSAEIEGDHLAPVVWRDRLYLFWVTFMFEPQPNSDAGAQLVPGALADAKLTDLMTGLNKMVESQQLDVRLHWSEYVNGQWGTHESTGRAPVIAQLVSKKFTPRDTFIHVAKEGYEDGVELGVFIYLSGAIEASFYLAGRNSEPERRGYATKPANPFTSAKTEFCNRYSGTGALAVTFNQKITTEKVVTNTATTADLLRKCEGYTLLPCDNDLMPLSVSDDALSSASNQEAVAKAIASGLAEIASLEKPVFFQDNRLTLFVEPSVTEKTVEEWFDWVTPTIQTDTVWSNPALWKNIDLTPAQPVLPLPHAQAPWVLPVDKASVIRPPERRDWLINPGTALNFDGVLIGPGGQPGIQVMHPGEALVGAGRLTVDTASGLATGSAIVLSDSEAFAGSGLERVSGGLNVVGGGGWSAALAKNIGNHIHTGVAAGSLAAGGLGR